MNDNKYMPKETIFTPRYEIEKYENSMSMP